MNLETGKYLWYYKNFIEDSAKVVENTGFCE